MGEEVAVLKNSAKAPTNQKKSGNKALIAIGALFLLLAPLIVITGIAYTLTLPKIYASQAIIEINNDKVNVDPFGSSATSGMYDPYLLRT